MSGSKIYSCGCVGQSLCYQRYRPVWNVIGGAISQTRWLGKPSSGRECDNSSCDCDGRANVQITVSLFWLGKNTINPSLSQPIIDSVLPGKEISSFDLRLILSFLPAVWVVSIHQYQTENIKPLSISAARDMFDIDLSPDSFLLILL